MLLLHHSPEQAAVPASHHTLPPHTRHQERRAAAGLTAQEARALMQRPHKHVFQSHAHGCPSKQANTSAHHFASWLLHAHTHLPEGCIAHCDGHPQRLWGSSQVDCVRGCPTHQHRHCSNIQGSAAGVQSMLPAPHQGRGVYAAAHNSHLRCAAPPDCLYFVL